jgi:integrase
MATLREALVRRLTQAPARPIYLSAPPAAVAIVRTNESRSGASPSANPEDRYPDIIDPETFVLAPVPAPIGDPEAAAIRGYLDASQAPRTRAAYRRDWAAFAGWCADRRLASLPASAETVARYLVDQADAGLRVATLVRRISAISQAHQAADLDTPTRALLVRKILAGIKRRRGVAQRAVAPILPDDLRAMLALLDDSPAGLRDRAILLLGFAGAFRRSEIVALDVGDLVMRREGLVVTLRRSKTDQEGQGTVKGIPSGRHAATCPVRAVGAWIAAARLTGGPLFRPIDRHGNIRARRLADFHVARLIKRLAAACGLDASLYSGHSLRAGLATAAAAAGVAERAIMRQTGHRSERIVRRYIRDGALFRENAAGAVGL